MTFQQDIEQFFEEHGKLLDKYRLKMSFSIDFPGDKTPLLGKIALKILNWKKAELKTKFIRRK